MPSPMTQLKAQEASTSTAASSTNSQPSVPVLPRGKKLMLKDGSFQLVREYQVQGDRVRYYDMDSSTWQVMPADLVDWEATKKIEAEEAQRDAAMIAKIHTQEAARAIEPLDIDASLEVAPGVFLPPGDNLFAFDGKTILPLSQAETNAKLSKGRLLEQVLVPVPIVPSRQTVSIHGARAKFRLRNKQPEFFIRTVDAREPDIELIRAKVRGENRQIENLDKLFGEQHVTSDTLSMQKWQVAHGVYRFTLSQPLEPGEYALAVIVRDEGTSLYVWVFGIEPATASAESRPK